MFNTLLWILIIIGIISLLRILILLLLHIGLYVTDQFSGYNCKYTGRITRSYFSTSEFNEWYFIPTFGICFDGINSGITFYWLKYSFSISTDFLTEKEEDAINTIKLQK